MEGRDTPVSTGNDGAQDIVVDAEEQRQSDAQLLDDTHSPSSPIFSPPALLAADPAPVLTQVVVQRAEHLQPVPEIQRSPSNGSPTATTSSGAGKHGGEGIAPNGLAALTSAKPGVAPVTVSCLHKDDADVLYKGMTSGSRKVGRLTLLTAHVATLPSPFNWLNWAWGVVFTILVPAILAIFWYGVIPVGSPITGSYSDRWVWVFIIHPLSMAVLSYLLISLFLTSIEESHPWRPMPSYMHIVVFVYFQQAVFPGLVVFFDEPFALLALPSVVLVFVCTLVGLRLTPHCWIDCNKERFSKTLRVFMKLSIVFIVWLGILAAYMIANAESDGTGQGFLTVALNILCFIAKKFLLAYTDPIAIETAMLVAGFWLENLTDVFIVLAFPTAERFGATFAIIFLARIGENLAYLCFQTTIWFRFRVWIKAKFKKSMGGAITEDGEEYADDRGHSEHRPGYQRRQLRFLVLKIFSQVSSYVYFLVVVPVLRFGPNKRRFPFADPIYDVNTDRYLELQDSILDADLQSLPKDNFERAMIFAAFAIVATLVGGLGMWLWMHHYYRSIIVQIRRKYNTVVIQPAHYGLVLSIMLVNALIATSCLQIYYRVYFV